MTPRAVIRMQETVWTFSLSVPFTQWAAIYDSEDVAKMPPPLASKPVWCEQRGSQQSVRGAARPCWRGAKLFEDNKEMIRGAGRDRKHGDQRLQRQLSSSMASSFRGGLTDLSNPLNIGIKKHLPHHKAGAPQPNGGLNFRPVRHSLIPGRRNRERFIPFYGSLS